MATTSRTMEELIAEAVRAAVRDELAPLLSRLASALPEEVVTPEEAARRTGLSIATIRRAYKSGALPVQRLGKRKVMIPVSGLRTGQDGQVVELAHAARFRGRGK